MKEASTDYGDVRLSLTDALYGHKLDMQFGGWSPMRVFDPHDIGRLFVQDAIVLDGGGLPDIYVGWYCDVQLGVVQPRWAGGDEAFADYAKAMREALLLPLSERFHKALQDVWEDWWIVEAERRILAAERRARTNFTSDWETADLVAEVEAVCGEGRKVGRQYVFRCPFHQDRDPSLTVDPVKRTWFCWPCNRGGGVIAWRKANGK